MSVIFGLKKKKKTFMALIHIYFLILLFLFKPQYRDYIHYLYRLLDDIYRQQ